ncbi:alpha/beta fold hydrolase [Microbacterium sp. cx-59]|uniref:alpha/beta fold hydrolase n=1 Tax=Microbacterium sp. cx-59 TaxID=2891207 RepID=UPI001E3EC464|nr:alpha/beta hydrolase [Microbacterium sp. cx-59]MCC4907323.1 alpha/beta hydrolase [Microbacterium sp. cx-59]
MSNITVVLVHGAFAESASWSGVISVLQEAGVAVIATPNPLRSVVTDAENVRSAVASLGTPVLLVGHSYGGSVITQAAAGDEHVKGLVYVSAFAPDHGETALELTGQFPGSTLGDRVRPYPLGDGTNDLVVDRELYPDQFAADVPLDLARVSAITQRPIRDAALGEPLAAETPAWRTLPSWFVFGTGDKNIPVEALTFMADRAGSRRTHVIDGALHSSMVSHPDAVATLILEALDHLA